MNVYFEPSTEAVVPVYFKITSCPPGCSVSPSEIPANDTNERS